MLAIGDVHIETHLMNCGSTLFNKLTMRQLPLLPQMIKLDLKSFHLLLQELNKTTQGIISRKFGTGLQSQEVHLEKGGGNFHQRSCRNGKLTSAGCWILKARSISSQTAGKWSVVCAIQRPHLFVLGVSAFIALRRLEMKSFPRWLEKTRRKFSSWRESALPPNWIL